MTGRVVVATLRWTRSSPCRATFTEALGCESSRLPLRFAVEGPARRRGAVLDGLDAAGVGGDVGGVDAVGKDRASGSPTVLLLVALRALYLTRFDHTGTPPVVSRDKRGSGAYVPPCGSPGRYSPQRC